ncbi:MAG: hypothetical protein V1721_09885 [Pseudomonadota bacterium]
MSSVFSFGSGILDENYTLKDSTETTCAYIIGVINKEIKRENEAPEAQGKTPIPKIDLNPTANVNDDRLYPVLKRAAEILKDELSLNEGPGGSVFNAQQAFKAILGDDANDIEMYHKKASLTKTVILTLKGVKIYGSVRPVRDMDLTDGEIEKVRAADLITFPKSSMNDYPGIVEAIISHRKTGSKIVMNVHSSNKIDDMDLYMQADAWIGTVDEMKAINLAKGDEFLKKGGIIVETMGGDGVRIRCGTEFDKSYKTLKVEPEQLKGTKTGAGNGVEGVLFGYLLGKIGKAGEGLEATMKKVADLGNAAGRAVMDKMESFLSKDDHDRILKYNEDIRCLGVKELAAKRDRNSSGPQSWRM